jgi:HAD superfamily hydrolase (TIGR01509 family)
MLRAVIFDFNGILIDDEPVHMEIFRQVLREQGITLEPKDYYARYLGLDDRGCFQAVYHDLGRSLDDQTLAQLIRRKAHHYKQAIENRLVVFPGVSTLIPELSSRLPLAIASGALRDEIEPILKRIGLRHCFQAVVSAEDVSEGKPSPEIFLKALSALNLHQLGLPIRPAECLAIEDSKDGILAAHAAGMKCLAVTNSYPASELTGVEAVVSNLSEVTLPFLEQLFR